MRRQWMIRLLILWLAGCGGANKEPDLPKNTGGTMASGEHLLIEPDGNPRSLLGRPVTLNAEGGVEIGEALAPDCDLVNVQEKKRGFDKTFHQETRKAAGFSADVANIASASAGYKGGTRIESAVYLEKELIADLRGTCGDMVVKSVKVGRRGRRTFQYWEQGGGSVSAGWKNVSLSGGGASADDIEAKVTWGDDPKGFAFTIGPGPGTQAELNIRMPRPIVAGTPFSPTIDNNGERDLWLIVFSCDQANNKCRGILPSPSAPVEKIGAHQSKTLDPLVAPEPSSERLWVYGFPEEGDYKKFKPEDGDLGEAEFAEYALGLEDRLKPITAKRWINKPYRYTVLPADEVSEPPGPEKKQPIMQQWISSKPAGVAFTKTEITLGQFKQCVSDSACSVNNMKTKADNDHCNWGYSDRDDHPMNCVDWYGAQEFCAWIGGRLPTAEEWYAEASNGGKWNWPWGATPDVSCSHAVWGDGSNTKGCGKDGTWPVCSKTQGNSVNGLCDMCGNVWEWTSTDYDLKNKVLRGGSWDLDKPDQLRSSQQRRYGPDFQVPYFGIRCVR